MKRSNVFPPVLIKILVGFLFFPVHFGLSQALFEEHLILEEFQGATCIATADFDGDGDIDFTVTSNQGNKVSWFENDGAQQFTEHLVVAGFIKAKGVTVAKIDNNDSWDIVATAKTLGRFSWFANDGAGNFTEQVIADSTWTSADFVYAADVDQDGDCDVILVGCDDNRIAWAENDGNGQFVVTDLKTGWTKANWATVYDLDDDDDMDILATAKAGQLIWFVNDGNQQFTETVLVDGVSAINSVQVADLDADGDPDLTATACGNSDKVMWYENDGNFGYTEHILKSGYNGGRASKIADLDLDGDIDILSIAWETGVVHFWENDGLGAFAERIVSGEAYDMIQVHAADLDQDGDPDILGACFGTNEIRWWESLDSFLVPGFSANPATGQQPLEVQFTDTTYAKPAIHTWSWDFNNDGVMDSQEPNPQWTYPASGKYTVTLIVANDSVSDTVCIENLVRVFDGESSFEFNGCDTRVLCTGGEPLNLKGNFSVEAWIKPVGFGITGIGKIMDKLMFSFYANGHSSDLPNDTSLAVMMVHQDGTISRFSTPAGSLQTGAWQHVAFSYDSVSSEAHLYLNGIDQVIDYVTSPSGPLMQNGTRNLYLGNGQIGDLALEGSLDEVRLWNHIRTGEAINEWMEFNLPENPIGLHGYWKMNEGAGEMAFDLSGNQRNALRGDARWDLGIDLLNVSSPDVILTEQPVVLVFPNPVKDKAILISEVQLDRVILMDLMGKKLQEFRIIDGNSEIDISKYPNGVYFLKCEMYGRNYQIRRIIKQ